MARLKTVYCTAFAGPSIGGSDWVDNHESARARFFTLVDDPIYHTDDLMFFHLEVPNTAQAEEITRLVDEAANHGSHLRTDFGLVPRRSQ